MTGEFCIVYCKNTGRRQCGVLSQTPDAALIKAQSQKRYDENLFKQQQKLRSLQLLLLLLLEDTGLSPASPKGQPPSSREGEMWR